MKLLLIVVLVCVVMIIAKSVSAQYKDRYEFYVNLKSFLNEFKINLSFKQYKLNEFLSRNKANSSFNIFINEYQNFIEKGEIHLDKISFLEQDEIAFLEEMITSIGKYDVKNEIVQLDSFLVLIDEKLAKANNQKMQLCPMINKLSFLFAIGLVIILI